MTKTTTIHTCDVCGKETTSSNLIETKLVFRNFDVGVGVGFPHFEFDVCVECLAEFGINPLRKQDTSLQKIIHFVKNYFIKKEE